jgi:hypothetical protein
LKYQIPYIVKIASVGDYKFSEAIVQSINESAQKRGVNLAQRSAAYIKEKMKNGLAVIAVTPDHKDWLGFSYIEVWDHRQFVANSGLIVKEEFRGIGISKDIKLKIFNLSQEKFPFATMFSLSSNAAVIRANFEMGFRIVSFDEVLHDQRFLTGFNCLVDYIGMMKNGMETSGHVAMIYKPLSLAGEAELIHSYAGHAI